MKIRAVLVDDEPLAVDRLRDLLEQERDVDVVGQAETAADAATLVTTLQPDVVFVDIRIPRTSGLELVATLNPRPIVVFATAYPEFAVDAFDANAVDYLVKPITPERLHRSLDRVRGRMLHGAIATSPQIRMPERIAVRTRAEVVFVDVAEVYWIGAEGNYSRVYTKAKSYLIRELINEVAQRLDPAAFMRVHRSSIVNARHVQKLISTREGSVAVLTNGTQVRVAAQYRPLLQRLLR